MNNKELIAKDLLSIKAVFLRPEEPFTWASGIKSPIYCDNRLTLSFPAVRQTIEQTLADLILTHYPECEMIMGTSTAGIPHAAIVASILNLPMGYVRSSSKAHGRNNQIEGACKPGTKVVVIEDLISTGGSCIDVVNVLREANVEVLGVAAIFTYGMKKAEENFTAIDCPYVTCSDYDTLIDIAVKENYIKEDQKAKLLAFRDQPTDESWMN